MGNKVDIDDQRELQRERMLEEKRAEQARRAPRCFVECDSCNRYIPEEYRADHAQNFHENPNCGEGSFHDLNDSQQTVANWSDRQAKAFLLRLLSNYPAIAEGRSVQDLEDAGLDAYEIIGWLSNEFWGEEREA